MTAKAKRKPFNVSDGIVVRNVKRNVAGSREQLRRQTKLEGGRHNDAAFDHPTKTECSTTEVGARPTDEKRL